MKVLVVGSYKSHYVISHLNSLVELGYSAVFLNTDGHYTSSHDLIKVIQLPFNLNNKGSFKYLGYLLLVLLFKINLKKENVDLVHAHYVTSAGLIVTMLKSNNIPTVVSARGSDIYKSKIGLRKLIVKYVIKKSDAMHCVSNMMAETVNSIGHKFNVPKAEVFTQGVRLKDYQFKNRSFSSNSLNIVVTRRLESVYDPITIVLAVSEFKKSSRTPINITFAAGGSLQFQLKSLCEKLNIIECVTFLGGFANSELTSILSQSDFYLSASLHDGISISLLEAAASGLVPVVSDIDSNREVLGSEVCQFYFNIKCVDSLLKCFLNLEKTPKEKLIKLAVHNRNAIEKKYSSEFFLKSLKLLYKSVTRDL